MPEETNSKKTEEQNKNIKIVEDVNFPVDFGGI